MGGRLDLSQFLYDSKLACPFNYLHKGLDLHIYSIERREYNPDQ
jgi:hypothetical protein